MKRFLAIGAMLLIFLYAGLVAAKGAEGPTIEVKELQHDFGKVVQGTQATHIFEVRNRGTEPLIIERVQTS